MRIDLGGKSQSRTGLGFISKEVEAERKIFICVFTDYFMVKVVLQISNH